ncbi:MAG: putative toxin-antitoxin system toxin component, PIN family [Dehalococcoidia bacterium]
MTRATFDANVLASGFVRPQGPPGQLLQRWRAGAFTLIVSDPLIGETERTLEKPYFAERLTHWQRANNIALLRREAVVTPLTETVTGVATHPEDDLVLAAAVSAHSDYLVTGDRKLQAMGMYDSVRILSPRQFLDVLDAQIS